MGLKFYFGDTYEIKLIRLIIGEKETGADFVKRMCDFGNKIIKITDPNLFSTNEAKTIVTIIGDYCQKYKNVPYFDEIKAIIKTQYKLNEKDLLSYLLEVFRIKISDEKSFIQDSASSFFQQQKLAGAISKINDIIKGGEYQRYNECVSLIKDALKENDIEENHYIVNTMNPEDIPDKPKDYIKLGWGDGIESFFSEGKGLVKGGIYGIFAPSGAGKTTSNIITLANAFKQGRTVVQVFFEGTMDDMKKMQLSHWSGLGKSSINANNTEFILHHANEKIQQGKTNGGAWIIKKFRPNKTKWDDIENYLDKLIEMGYFVDLVSIDYGECIEPSKKYHTDYGGELEIVKDFESYCEMQNICGIMYFQGNREAQDAEILLEKHMGGNFKKLQPCHVMITLAMPSNNKTNIVLLKNRLGEGYKVFTNCPFNRGNVSMSVPIESLYGSVSDYKKNMMQ